MNIYRADGITLGVKEFTRTVTTPDGKKSASPIMRETRSLTHMWKHSESSSSQPCP